MIINKTAAKTAAVLLAVILTFSLTSCSIPDGIARFIPWLASENAEEVVDDTLNGYVIIRSDSADTDVLDISKEIKDAFADLGYNDAEIKTDFAGKDNPPAKEILVGTTNRDGNIDVSDFKDGDYEIKGAGHKIYIAAKTPSALKAAAEYFIKEILPKLSDGTLKCGDIAYKYEHEYPIKTAFVGQAPLAECAVVVGDEVTLTERNAIADLTDKIYDLTGTRLPIISEGDEKVGSARGLIVFGGKSDDASSLLAIAPANGYALRNFGDKLVAVSNVRYGILKAVGVVYDAFFAPERVESYENGRCDLVFAGDVKGEFDYETYLTENAKAPDTSLPSKTEIRGMTTDNLTNPIGMDNSSPRFEWYYASPADVRGEKQLSYRIGVATSPDFLASGDYNVWDSGVVESADNFAVMPLVEAEVDAEDENVPKTPVLVGRLAKSSRYYWQVTANTAKSGEVKSKVAYFETGLMDGGMSDAVWICEDEYYCGDTVGRVEAKFTLGKNAAGVSFGFNENEDFYYMWQFNTSNKGYAVLRPHIYNAGSWSYLPEVSLKDMFPTAEDASKAPVTMSIKINDGIITTYINDKLVSTNNVDPFPIGKVRERLSGGESAEFEYIRILDESGGVLYDGEKGGVPMYRYDFTTEKSVVGARLYASALGAYEVYLNGKKLGDSLLSPGRTAYNEKIYYQTYDVTSLITEKNAIAAIVGDGWYNSSIVGGSYGDKNAFIAKLVLIYEDGSEESIVTGDGWKYSSAGPVVSADFYDGERYDARLEKSDMSLYGGCSDWQNAKVCTSPDLLMQGTFTPGTLTAEATEPVRKITAYRPIAVTNPEEGVYVCDFGQNMAGTVSVKMNGESGKSVTFTYGEYLNPETGKPETAYMLGHNGTDTYIFRGDAGGETFSPTLVYHGFRYLMIEGLSEKVKEDDVTAYMISNDTKRTGSFESSDALLNRYYENTLMSQRSNFVSNLTDCPTREKNGWTGDAQIFAKTAAFNSDVRSIYGNFLEMMRSSMSDGGAVPEIIPSRGTSNTTKTPAGWSDAIVTIPYELYMQYGNRDILVQNYDSMKAWISYFLKYKLDPENGDYVRKDGNYGDHLAYNNGKENFGYSEKEYGGNGKDVVKRETSYSEIATAYTAYSCSLISEVAEILGNTDDAAYYSELSGKFADAWRKNFLEEDGVTSKANSQTSYVMGLYFDLYETPEKKSAAADKLCALIESSDGCQTVGFIGISYILDALSDNGKTDAAYKLLRNTKAPSLLYPVTMDATTTWESYTGGSHNHYVQGSPVRWLYTDILGIDHDRVHTNAGYRHFNLSPKPESLEYANGEYVSANGVIKSAWKKTEKGYTYECTVPANTSATLTLPISGNAVVSESGNKVESGVSGLSVVSKDSGKIVLELESGVYSFIAENIGA